MARPIHLHRRSAVGTDAGAAIAGQALEVHRNVNALLAARLGHLGVAPGGHVNPGLAHGLQAQLHRIWAAVGGGWRVAEQIRLNPCRIVPRQHTGQHVAGWR